MTETAAEPVGAQAAETRARSHALITAIDAMIGAQLDAILHHARLQQLEALWRNMAWLTAKCPASSKLRLLMLDAQWAEIARDMERAPSADRTSLYAKVYSRAIGMPGGKPFGLLVIDHQFAHRRGGKTMTDDIEVVARLSEIAAASFCPILLAAHSRLLGMDSFEDLDLRQDLSGAFRGPEYERFRRLRAAPDTRFVALALPRILMRPVYQDRALTGLGFRYRERIDRHEDLLWGSAAFGMAMAALRAMDQHRWPAAIRGAAEADSGGIVDGPARALLPGDVKGVVARFPTENAVSERQEIELNAIGVTALRQCHLTGSAAFYNVPSLHAPRADGSAGVDPDARISSMLNYVLCVSRFAHYIKVMAREWIGEFANADDYQRRLREWIAGYVQSSDDGDENRRASQPLRSAEIDVVEQAGSPGSFLATVALRPHYQLDHTNSEFKLTTEIGRPVQS